jgi:heme A synthase
VNAPITVHFLHRVVGIIALIAVVGLAVWAVRTGVPAAIRTWSLLAVGLVIAQVTLGFISVLSVLAVVPVSLHTLVAASLLAALVHIAALARAAGSANFEATG